MPWNKLKTKAIRWVRYNVHEEKLDVI